MSYAKRIIKAGGVIDVLEYHSAKYGAPGEKRAEKREYTREDVEKANQRNKTRKAWYLILANFKQGDYFLTLTYRPEERPQTMKEAQRDFNNFVRRLRRRYKKEGYELKWIRNIEQGTKGAWHIHLIINRIPGGLDMIIQQWAKGRIRADSMYEEGQFRKLAAYITKTPRNEERVRQSSYSTSYGLIHPKPEVRYYLTYRTWRKIRIPKGYYLDPDSLIEGTNQFTGYRYRSYTLIQSMRC